MSAPKSLTDDSWSSSGSGGSSLTWFERVTGRTNRQRALYGAVKYALGGQLITQTNIDRVASGRAPDPRSGRASSSSTGARPRVLGPGGPGAQKDGAKTGSGPGNPGAQKVGAKTGSGPGNPGAKDERKDGGPWQTQETPPDVVPDMSQPIPLGDPAEMSGRPFPISFIPWEVSPYSPSGQAIEDEFGEADLFNPRTMVANALAFMEDLRWNTERLDNSIDNWARAWDDEAKARVTAPIPPQEPVNIGNGGGIDWGF